MQTFLSKLNYRRYFVGLFTLTMPLMLAVLGIGVLMQNIRDGQPGKEWNIGFFGYLNIKKLTAHFVVTKSMLKKEIHTNGYGMAGPMIQLNMELF